MALFYPEIWISIDSFSYPYAYEEKFCPSNSDLQNWRKKHSLTNIIALYEEKNGEHHESPFHCPKNIFKYKQKEKDVVLTFEGINMCVDGPCPNVAASEGRELLISCIARPRLMGPTAYKTKSSQDSSYWTWWPCLPAMPLIIFQTTCALHNTVFPPYYIIH